MDQPRAISRGSYLLPPGEVAESEAAYYTLKTVRVALNCACHPHPLTRVGHRASPRNLCVAVVTWTFCIQVSFNPGLPTKMWVRSPWDSLLLKPKAFEGKYALGSLLFGTGSLMFGQWLGKHSGHAEFLHT